MNKEFQLNFKGVFAMTKGQADACCWGTVFCSYDIKLGVYNMHKRIYPLDQAYLGNTKMYTIITLSCTPNCLCWVSRQLCSEC